MKRILLSAAVAAAMLSSAPFALASSHREAPGITEMPKVDASDFYMFKSTETGRGNFVTLIANYLPLQDSYGGPNYFTLDPDALYEIHVDNNGDSVEDITFQFRFQQSIKKQTVPVRNRDGSTTNTEIPLVVSGPVTADGATVNLQEGYVLSVARGGRRTVATPVSKGGTPVSASNALGKPLDYIGTKTFSSLNYNTYSRGFIHEVSIPGCATPAKVFVGQRADPFYLSLGKIFDLLNFSAADITGANGETGGVNTLANKAVTSFALEVDQACLRSAATEPVIGGWTTASVRQNRIVDTKPAAINASTREIGPWAQVSRLGMPLVNEVVIGLSDKDRFNASKPVDDTKDPKFGSYVLNPSFPTLVQALFGVQPPPAPRNDLLVAFLTGIPGLNKPSNASQVPGEMLRLNTSIAATPLASASPLGVLGGDNAGFPNGRRVFDDVVDATVRVAQGALCTLNNQAVFGCVTADAPGGAIPYTDRVRPAISTFPTAFPYLNAPQAGDL